MTDESQPTTGDTVFLLDRDMKAEHGIEVCCVEYRGSFDAVELAHVETSSMRTLSGNRVIPTNHNGLLLLRESNYRRFTGERLHIPFEAIKCWYQIGTLSEVPSGTE